uniref:phenylalanine--tRNA ligase n=1 Tax=Chondria sp. (in: red algae) TaxID=1982705 RepID=A0A1Z1MCT3_9FLOR|nr:Phenylalanine-tRNA ligase beta subunit [Chondria sp. (in: red algae)]
MKFSWKLINCFIDIEHIEPKTLEEKLALSGIEVEEIKEIVEIEDKIIDASVTANRKDIQSIISLSKEIGIIINNKLKINPIRNFGNLNNYNHKNSEINNSIQLSINEIKNIHCNETPKWINKYLKLYNIHSSNIIHSIQKYIEIKWGQTFYILNKNEALSRLNLLNNNKFIYESIALNYDNDSKFLVFSEHNIKHNAINRDNNNYSEYYFNSYLDTIKTLSTFTQCRLGKLYCLFKTKHQDKYKQTIKINTESINTILGKLTSKSFKYISNRSLLYNLNRLNLIPKYNPLTKEFLVQIPRERTNDLYRTIDIIEEIGRIKGYHHFLHKLHKYNTKGKIDKTSIKIKQIRKILRQFGLNEVINCCLVNNKFQNNNVKLYNPITQEQCELRNNILEGLINNYIYNIKQQNNEDGIEIFEIGKIFQKKSVNNYVEAIHLGGLIYNNNFIRESWCEESSNPSFFHLKGFIETLIEQLNLRAFLKIIESNNENIDIHKNFFHSTKNIGIYKENTQELIGILGEINPIYINKLNDNKVYVFELNINQLDISTNKNYHLHYRAVPYSTYPSVTRDISIKINKTRNIKSIQELFSRDHNSLIESIKVFNEYLHKESNMRSISLRIKYESKERTLNNKDIEKIDKEIYDLLSQFESKT